MPDRIAYLPLDTHPEAASDPAILAALSVARTLGCRVTATTFAVVIPPVAAPLGGYLINIEGMARAAEERSRAECQRLLTLVAEGAALVTTQETAMGGALGAAVQAAHYHDLAVVPVTTESLTTQDMAQALIFDSGRPVILVPAMAPVAGIDHIAIAWDESRVAARALGDALALLPPGGRVSVLTVQGEKPIKGTDPAQRLATALQAKGIDARAVTLAHEGKPIATVLQEAALGAGAQLLAMGGYGHSRLRDFVLGGATQGILGDLRLPVLVSH